MEARYQERMSILGNKILTNSRNELYLSMRFLDVALNSLAYEINLSTVTIGVDGEKILYHPNYLIGKYQDDTVLVNRLYIHMLLHCIFRHMMYEDDIELEYWNVACDIAVESIIDDLDYKCIKLTVSDARVKLYTELKQELKVLTAEGIYHTLKKKELSYQELKELEREFRSCDHGIWERLKNKPTEDNQDGSNQKQESQQENQRQQEETKSVVEKSSNENSNSDKKNENNKDSSNKKEEYVPSNMMEEELEDNWKDISDKIKTNIETLGRNITEDAKGLLESLKVENRERYDYKEFLRKFSVRSEELQSDIDSFDYIYYTYGLMNYDNMPFIEPLEYKEVNKIQEFAIVIDTSASCDETLIHKFLKESYQILTSSGSFGNKINICLIQCDEKVQSSVTIHSQEELEEYMDTFEIKGQGGTDFIPAFEYINTLVEKKSFHNLKGMLYFTDGHGIYPTKRPKYDVAFVFLEEYYSEVEVPTWAMKLIIEQGGLVDEY